jgi:hypothetical protein
VGVHLNYALLHLVFRDPKIRDFRREDANEENLLTDARAAVRELFPKALIYVDEKHPNDYLAVFCKNTDKCVAFGKAMLAPVTPPPQGDIPQGTLF